MKFNNWGQLLIILLIGIISGNDSYSKSIPKNTQVMGHLKWNGIKVTGFPNKIKVTSMEEPSFLALVDVDLLGKYSVNLPIGSYTISPHKNYHWMGEEYIRINNKTSLVFVTVQSNQDVTAPTLKLNAIQAPSFIIEKGILHDFNETKKPILDNFIKVYLEYFEIPGASLALIKNGKIIYSNTYGVKNSITKELVDDETLFEAGSVTKPAFAFSVLRLIEKGILLLDKPLYQYLSFDDVMHDDRYKLITTKNVLSHQSGLPNWAKRNEKHQFDLKFTPGIEFGYSGEGFEYLKRVVEHVTQKTISSILEDELIKPLKLKSTYFRKNNQTVKFSANGHIDNSPSEIRLFDSPMMAYSMKTNAKSFSTFILALRDEKGFKSTTYDDMFKIHSTRDDGVHWGLGFRIEQTPYGLVYGHSGSSSSGFISNFSFYEDLDMGYVIFTNSQMGGMLAIPLLTEFLITGNKKTLTLP